MQCIQNVRMGYVELKEETETRLSFGKSPSLRSWAILAGLFALGVGAAMYSNDYFLWKMAYVSGTIFIGLSLFDDWEECVFDKTKKEVTLIKQSLIQRLFQTQVGQKIVSSDLSSIISVSVEEEEVKYVGSGWNVVLHFDTGMDLSVTETAVIGNRDEQVLIAKKIHKFLGLEEDSDDLVDKEFIPGEEEEETEDDDYSSSEDSFEQIDKEEMDDIQSELPEPRPDPNL